MRTRRVVHDDPANPVQLAIGKIVAQFSGIAIEDIAVGTDGCGVPVFGITVKSMAMMYARLVAPPAEFGEEVKKACARIVTAMTNHPELIGGTSERLDTEMMRAAPGRIVSKVGAEGVYTAAILPCEDWPRGLGLALMEELVVRDGQVGNPSFTDYLIPTILDMPPMRLEILEYPDPHAPYGLRGAGEPPTLSSTPAIVAAIRDATGLPLRRVPVRPEHLTVSTPDG